MYDPNASSNLAPTSAPPSPLILPYILTDNSDVLVRSCFAKECTASGVQEVSMQRYHVIQLVFGYVVDRQIQVHQMVVVAQAFANELAGCRVHPAQIEFQA
jgi:hypothetical protein